MDGSFDERAGLLELDPSHVAMVEAFRACGGSANYTGSGGAVVGACPDPAGRAELAGALAALGCGTLAVPGGTPALSRGGTRRRGARLARPRPCRAGTAQPWPAPRASPSSRTPRGSAGRGALPARARALLLRGARPRGRRRAAGPGALADRLARAGVPVAQARARWWVREPAGPRRPPDLAGAVRTARVLHGLRPDLVVSSSLVAPSGALAAAALGLPHLWWIQEFGDRDHGYRFALGRRASLALAGLLSRRVLVPSEAVRAAVAPAVPRAPVHVLPYAVEVPLAPPGPAGPPGDPPRIAVLGRVRASKGQQDAVRALARMHRADAVLDVVGDGDPRDVEALRVLAARLGVAGRVALHGGRADPVSWLDRADVVVVGSRDEAFGRVAVEAMKRGRPVVGAARAGTAELVRDGETGRSYVPGDVLGLARALDDLLADDAERARLAAAGHRWARAAFTGPGHLSAFLAHADAAAGPSATRAGRGTVRAVRGARVRTPARA
jgi:glycosyltransferase involved in cell wall biosynthesis